MNTRIRFLSALLGAALTLSCNCLCLPVYCQEARDSEQIENKDEQVILRGLENPPEEPTTEKTGVPAKQQDDPPDAGLVPDVRREDYDVINTQAGEFRERFLKGEAIELRLPMPDQLIPLGGKLPPIRLEASYTNPVSLKDCVDYSINNNLAIRISREQATSQKWLFVGALGNFMPNILLNYRQEYLNGSRLIGGVIPVQFRTPNVTTSAGFNFFGFRGGSVLFGALSNLNQFRAAKQQVQGSINDVLLATTRAYYTMVRNEALLEIQTRAVDVSQAQVNLNRQLENAGTGTRFQVLQSETQLARDQQALLDQEVALRRAAVDLATTLNLNSAVNLLSVESQVKKVRLLEPEVGINRLINIAVDNRPELKYREFLRLAARRNIQVAAAPLYPQLNFFGTVTGSGATLTRQYAFTDPSYQTVAVAGPPLQFPIVDEAGRTATFAADNSSLGFGGGGGGGSGGRVILPAGQVLQTPQRVSRQIRKSYNIGIQLDWTFTGSGIPDMANIQSARAIARKTLLEANQELIKVIQEVRDSYLTSQTAERLIEVATKEVLSSAEQLRLARVRLANGVGTNIDVINAQRDFTNALVNKADAIITFNIAQAQLLRDVGLIGRETLTSGRLVR